MDVFSKEARSRIMSAIKGKNTKPEILVRKSLHLLGYRFRLHRKDLPGKPDIVLPKYRTVVLVHGCFWHQHPSKNCKNSQKPKTNLDYWEKKLLRNQARDKQNAIALKLQGWRVLIVWECQTKDEQFLRKKITKFLGKKI